MISFRINSYFIVTHKTGKCFIDNILMTDDFYLCSKLVHDN